MTGASCGSPSGNEATQSFDFWAFFTHSEHPYLHILLSYLVFSFLLFHYVLIICLIFMHHLTQHASTTISSVCNLGSHTFIQSSLSGAQQSFVSFRKLPEREVCLSRQATVYSHPKTLPKELSSPPLSHQVPTFKHFILMSTPACQHHTTHQRTRFRSNLAIIRAMQGPPAGLP